MESGATVSALIAYSFLSGRFTRRIGSENRLQTKPLHYSYMSLVDFVHRRWRFARVYSAEPIYTMRDLYVHVLEVGLTYRSIIILRTK